MKLYYHLILASLILVLSAFSNNLEPQMVELDKLYYENTFESVSELDKAIIESREETRWEIKNGYYEGIPSTIEYQKKKSGHNGSMPILNIQPPHVNFAMKFKIQFSGLGVEYKSCKIGLTRYAASLRWSKLGAFFVTNHLKDSMCETESFKLEDGKWYECLVEVFENEMLISFNGGPHIYGNHEQLYGKHGLVPDLLKNGLPNQKVFGLFGGVGTTLRLYDLEVWSVKSDKKETWQASQKKVLDQKGLKFNQKFDRKKNEARLSELIKKDPRNAAISKVLAEERKIKLWSRTKKN